VFRFAIALAVLTGIAGAAAAQQAPGPVGAPSGPWREQIHWVPYNAGGRPYLLYTRICRPASDAPARVVAIAHGSPPSAEARPGMSPTSCDHEAVRWFLDRGYIVAISMRLGYGATGGPDAEDYGNCYSGTDYARAGLETARQILATIDYAATLPFAKPSGAVAVGQSAGGWGVMALDSLPHPRVTAIVDMAGGRGGHQHNMPDSNCEPERLATAAGQFGRTAATPIVWITTQNDSFFSPEIVSAMYTAYTQAGGKAELHQLGSFGNDGHGLFFGRGGSAIWGPLVERYLATRPAQ
jgi:dienelactone hydrolase